MARQDSTVVPPRANQNETNNDDTNQENDDPLPLLMETRMTNDFANSKPKTHNFRWIKLYESIGIQPSQWQSGPNS